MADALLDNHNTSNGNDDEYELDVALGVANNGGFDDAIAPRRRRTGHSNYDTDNNYDAANNNSGQIRQLRQAMLAEQASPEVLPFKSELVEAVLRAVSERDEMLAEAEAEAIEDDMLPSIIYQTEIKRIKYMLRVYLRTRLKKIETFVLHILNSEELYARLSEQEQEFARGYTDAMDQLFTSSVLSHVPKDFDSLLKQSAASEGQDMVPEPNFETHVFCRIHEDVGTVELDSTGRSIDLNPGDLCIIRYAPIQPLVLEERLELW